METNRVNINKKLPKHSQIDCIHVTSEAFEKKPNRGIKRFLYHINANKKSNNS